MDTTKKTRNSPLKRTTTHTWISLVSPFLAILGFVISSPAIPRFDTVLLMGLFILLWLWSDRKSHQPFRIIEQAGALAILIGCTLDTLYTFPSRRTMLIIMASVVWWFFCKLMKEGEQAAAWLVLTIGMTTAPFTELHLERNIWTLSSCLMGMYYTIRSGRFYTVAPRRTHFSLLLWLLLTLLTLISGFWSVYPHMSIRFAGILLFQGLLFIQTVTVISDKKLRRSLLTVLVGFAAVYILAAGESFIIRVLSLGVKDTLGFRLYVFDRHPNYTIFYLLISLPLWLPIIAKNKTIARLAAIGGTAGSIAYIVFLSYSRQGFLVLILYAVILLLLVHEKKLRRMIRIIFSAGVISMLVTTYFYSPVRHRLMSIFDLSNSLRFQAWRVFADLIVDRPLLGYGLGTNRYIYPKALGFVRPGETATRQFLFEAHNAYIDILTGLGLVGLFIFVVFLFSCTIPRHLPRSLEQRTIFALGAGIWFDLMFNFRLHAQDTGTFLVVLLAFCAVINAQKKSSNFIKGIPHPGFRIALVTIAVIFCATPVMGKLWVKKAQSMLPGKEWQKIYKTFQKAAIIEPLNAHPHYFMALCQKQLQNQSKANDEFRTTVNLCPNYAFYRFHLATDLAEAGKTEAAMKQLEAGKILDLYDEDGRTRFTLGILEWRLGHRKAARQDFWTALLMKPNYIHNDYWKTNPDLRDELLVDLTNYAGSFMSKGYLTTIRTRSFLNTISILSKTGDQAFADRCLFAAAWNNPENLDVVIPAIVINLQKGKYDKAESLLYNSLAANPEHAILYSYLGYIYLEKENFSLAEKCIKRSSELWTEIAVDNYMGYQILSEIAHKTHNKQLLEKLRPKLKYLAGERYSRQLGDLSIHIGTSSYLVKSSELVQ
ncbi:O-antigen ligase family protein [bacterium]|nr:O-antigen ligase family protein [bacterium]